MIHVAKLVAILFSFFVLVACDNGSSSSDSDAKPEILNSTNYPIEVTGKLDIIDAGVGDSNYASWAIGSLMISGTSYEVGVEFEQSVLKDAGVDLEFEYGDTVTLWLNAPKNEYYQVSKMRK